MPIITTKDGRTIRKGADYSAFRRDLYNQQQGRCMKCGKETSLVVPIEWGNSFHVHHKGRGRGMGGSLRDDTAKTCTGLCGACHRRIEEDKKHGK